MNKTTINPAAPSFRDTLWIEVEEMVKQGKLKYQLEWPVRRLLEALGHQADLSPAEQTVESFGRVRASFLESDMAANTINHQLTVLRNVLKRLVPHGLKEACVKALTNVPRQNEREPVKIPRPSQFKTMLECLKSQVETIRLLIWLALSGGLQILDAVFMQFTNINWNTGVISIRRTKNGEIAEFGGLPPLMELLNQRRARLGQDAVYVMPELIFTEAELKSPKCNTVPWAKVPPQIAMRATAKAIKLVSAFFKSCGFDECGLNYKAFRRHHISLWSALGIKLKTRMWMCGHSHEALHNRFEMPLESEILKARDMTWKYLQAIQDGRPFPVSTTAYDIHECLIELPAIIQKASGDVQDSLRDIQKQNSATLAEIRAEIDGLAKAQQVLLDQCQQLVAASCVRKAA